MKVVTNKNKFNIKIAFKNLSLTALHLGLLFNLLPQSSLISSEFYITSVIREVPMKPSDHQYKDFYINAGTNNGLRKGVYLDAIRKIGIYDNINSKMIGDTTVKVARLKVIHTDKNFSIARLVEYYDKQDTPVSGYDSVIVGDLIQVSDKQ
jgi:hypothetical protein